MNLSALAAIVAANAKAAAVVTIATAATAGGGLAIADAAAGSHGSTGRDHAKSVVAKHTPAKSETTPAACPADVANHGGYVSSVAKATPQPSASPNAHGKAVSTAARSDCGKPAKGQHGNKSHGKPSGHPSGKPTGHRSEHPTGKPTDKP